MAVKKTILQNLIGEMKRGTLVLAVLLITRDPAYGYSLVGDLQAAGIDVEQNTLYPLLRRLESQGLMSSFWDTSESRPRKYYQVTQEGVETAELLTGEWETQHAVMDQLIIAANEKSEESKNEDN